HALAHELLRLVVPRGTCRRVHLVRHDREVEGRALAGLALGPDPPAHQLAQALADGEPEARAAVSAGRRGVDLAEDLEQTVEPSGGNTDAGVADGEVNLMARAVHLASRHGDPDVTRRGEPDRVAEEVDEDLAEMPGVAHDPRGGRLVHRVRELEIRAHDPGRDELQRVLDARRELEGRLLELELAGFDLREVEDLV